jgi:hypothetical protein
VLGDVGDPGPLEGVGGELAEDQGVQYRVEHSLPAKPAGAAPVDALQAQVSHEPLHALLGAPDVVTEPQLGVNPGAAVATESVISTIMIPRSGWRRALLLLAADSVGLRRDRLCYSVGV